MNIPFKDLFTRMASLKSVLSFAQGGSFIKADKKIFVILGPAFGVFIIALFCYWFLIEKPYYVEMIGNNGELIKDLKFTRDKLRKIHENTVASYEDKLKTEYIQKSIYDERVKDYEQKLETFKSGFIAMNEHDRQIKELEQKLKEESQSKENQSKENYEQKILALEQKVSSLEDKYVNQKIVLENSLEFVNEEKETLENTLLIERRKVLIPSLILPEIMNRAITADILKKLVTTKDRLERLEEMNVILKPDTYFEMGLVSYYNKQNDKAIEQWENAVSLNKNNVKAYICLGIAYNEEEMYDNAVKILKRAIEINPKYATLHLVLARIYEQNEMLDDAIYEYSEVIEINQEAVDIHYILGTLYERNGMKEEAKKCFAQYEKLKGKK